MIDYDRYTEKKLSSTGSTQHVYVKEEEWTVIHRDVVDEKKTQCAIVLHAQTLEIEVCERNVLNGFRVHKSEVSVLIDLTTKSAKTWWFNRQRWSGCVSAQLIFIKSLTTLSSLRWS